VAVLSAGQAVFENLANGGEVKVNLPSGTVSASLVPAGAAGPVIVGPADVALAAGTAVIVYGLGSFERGTMAVATEAIPGLGPRPTGVNTGNSAPPDGARATPTWALLAPLGPLALLIGLAGRRRFDPPIG
jgi:hypothetical protein